MSASNPRGRKRRADAPPSSTAAPTSKRGRVQKGNDLDAGVPVNASDCNEQSQSVLGRGETLGTISPAITAAAQPSSFSNATTDAAVASGSSAAMAPVPRAPISLEALCADGELPCNALEAGLRRRSGRSSSDDGQVIELDLGIYTPTPSRSPSLSPPPSPSPPPTTGGPAPSPIRQPTSAQGPKRSRAPEPADQTEPPKKRQRASEVKAPAGAPKTRAPRKPKPPPAKKDNESYKERRARLRSENRYRKAMEKAGLPLPGSEVAAATHAEDNDNDLEAAMLQAFEEDEEDNGPADLTHAGDDDDDVDGLEAALLKGFAEDDDDNGAAEPTTPGDCVPAANAAPTPKPAADAASSTQALHWKGTQAKINARAGQMKDTIQPLDDPNEDLSRFQPAEYTVIQEGDEGYGGYYAKVVFYADPCPPELRHSAFDLGNFEWKKIVAYEKKTTIDGERSKKRHMHDGQHIIGGVFERITAAEKLSVWRKRIQRATDRENSRKPHLVTLVEREPCGQQGEAPKWAIKIKQVADYVKRLSHGSRITIVLDCNANPSVAKGYYQEWFNTLDNLSSTHPQNVFIKFDDTSILHANPTPFHPAQPDFHAMDRSVDRDYLISIREDPDSPDVAETMQRIRNNFRISHQTMVARVEGCFEHARAFVRKIQARQAPTPDRNAVQTTATDNTAQMQDLQQSDVSVVAVVEQTTASSSGQTQERTRQTSVKNGMAVIQSTDSVPPSIAVPSASNSQSNSDEDPTSLFVPEKGKSRRKDAATAGPASTSQQESSARKRSHPTSSSEED